MKKDILKFETDPTGRLKRFCESVRNKYFPKLSYVHINYVFRSQPKKDDEGFIVLGEARKLSNRERDLYGFDFEICMFKKTWKAANDREKERLAWHELNHLIVKYGEVEEEPKRDKAGRIAIAMRRHDLVLRTFMEEIEKFGPTKSESIVIRKIQKYKSKRRTIKRR
jgi:hypothetical protein